MNNLFWVGVDIVNFKWFIGRSDVVNFVYVKREVMEVVVGVCLFLIIDLWMFSVCNEM